MYLRVRFISLYIKKKNWTFNYISKGKNIINEHSLWELACKVLRVSAEIWILIIVYDDNMAVGIQIL